MEENPQQHQRKKDYLVLDNMKKWTIIVFILLMISLVNALDYKTHQQDTQLNFSITSNNASSCNLTTINSPLGILTINQEGVKTSQTFSFNIAGENYSEFGTYCHNIECGDSSTIISGQECYEINYYGKELTDSQSTIYIGLLVVFLFILFSIFFGMKYLPDSNTKDEYGRILSVSYLKYLRLPLWISAYFIVVAIIYLSSNIAYAFLSEQLFAKTLFSIFAILMAVSPVIIIVLMISFFIKFYHDKEFQNMLNRGVFPGGNL